uniref:Uncharacterized protein LOC108039083 n=1 Tax=Drosophila rhopaloa TaxID=1041015 RepID=A0A6P4E0V4_DRORH
MSENEEYEYRPGSDSTRSPSPPAATNSTDSGLSEYAERIASPPCDPAGTPPPPALVRDGDADSQSTIPVDPSYECEVSSGSNGPPRQEEEPPAQDVEPDTRGLTTARLARLNVAGSPAVGYSTSYYLMTAWLESVVTPAFAEGFEERCVQESQTWVPHPAPSTDDSSVGGDGRFAEANDAWADYAARPRTPTASTASTASREADATGDSFMGTSVSGSLSDDAEAEAVAAESPQIDEGEEGTDPTPGCPTTRDTQQAEAEARTPSPQTTAAQSEPLPATPEGESP